MKRKFAVYALIEGQSYELIDHFKNRQKAKKAKALIQSTGIKDSFGVLQPVVVKIVLIETL